MLGVRDLMSVLSGEIEDPVPDRLDANTEGVKDVLTLNIRAATQSTMLQRAILVFFKLPLLSKFCCKLDCYIAVFG